MILRHHFGLGDAVLLTGLLRDIERAYPGQYEVLLDANFREIYKGRSDAREVTRADRARLRNKKPVDLRYQDGIRAARRGERVHITRWLHRNFERRTGLSVPLTEPHADPQLTPAEQDPIVHGRYWVVVAGGKKDITNKFWWDVRWQEVVNSLREAGIHCVQAGALHRGHRHAKLRNVTNLVGHLPHARSFLRLIRDAEGVIAPVTAATHIAAAFHRPCVTLLGGREEPWGIGYVDAYEAFGPDAGPVPMEHRLLHTVGMLSCCESRGCWKRQTLPNDDTVSKSSRPDDLCKLPQQLSDGRAVPRCMDLIQPGHVVEAVMSYYKEGYVPPIDPNTPPPEPIPLERIDGAVPTSQPPQGEKKGGTAKDDAKRRGPTTPKNARGPQDYDRFDHPHIGGKFTIFVLCYGDHTDLAKRCLDSILETVPDHRLDLRVATNAVVPKTLEYIEKLPTTAVYVNEENRKKYPVMREIFRDQENPIETPYLIWLDDDTQVVDPMWLKHLSEAIVNNHSQGGRMYGWPHFHDLRLSRKGNHDPKKWFESAKWWRGARLRVRNSNRRAPNGTLIDFVPGWCWALATHLIHGADIPDRRLNHNGGDITIGAQVSQAGYRIVPWNKNKKLVWCPKGSRRGYSEHFPWSPEGAKPKSS